MPDILRKEALVVIAALLVLLGLGVSLDVDFGKLESIAPLALMLGWAVGLSGLFLWRLRCLERQFKHLAARRTNHLDSTLNKTELAECCRSYQELVESANSIILRWNTEGVINYANPYTLQFFGYAREEFIGEKVTETIVPKTESTGRDLEEMIEDISLNPEKYVQNENENICKDHRRVWISWTNKAIKDVNGRIVEILSIGNDVTEKRHYERQIHQLAHYDNLTQLPNRTLFADRLKQAIGDALRHRHEFAVFYIDLDRFKSVNDSLGHHRGDLLLQQVADRMQRCLRTTDTLARMGGDEFTIILEREDNRKAAVKAAIKVAKKLIAQTSEPFKLDGNELFLTLSMGIATYPHDGKNSGDLVKHADTAMYQAKSRANSSFLLFDTTMSVESIARLNMENELRAALNQNTLELYYQPAINIRTGHADYVEALLRWHHPQLGQINPSEFVSIAEECGLMLPLGNWVLREASRQAMVWRQMGFDQLMVAVNISLRQFENHSLVDDVRDALEVSGLPPARLALEITESTIMSDSDYGQDALRQISEMGVTLLIDDFGTGYSSLARLRSLPINTVKIDRSFIFDVTSPRKSDNQIVDAIIAMAHNMNMKVIAEGVETREQLQYLQERDCDYIQGFYISEARPASQLGDLLKSGAPGEAWSSSATE